MASDIPLWTHCGRLLPVYDWVTLGTIVYNVMLPVELLTGLLWAAGVLRQIINCMSVELPQALISVSQAVARTRHHPILGLEMGCVHSLDCCQCHACALATDSKAQWIRN